MHVHLDPVGGIAGDMFIAAILDCRPDLASGLNDVLASLPLENMPQIRMLAHTDGVLTGSRFQIDDPPCSGKSHSHFSSIRTMLKSSDLDAGVRSRAIDIFQHLARAEARVHGKDIEDVHFHEVGALDSIADIVLAAHLIEQLNARQWSAAPIPIGSGRIMSQHGVLPLPAPATLLLLEDFTVFDDGIKGERVTPTGAAILRHLAPVSTGPKEALHLDRSGTGFGTSQLPDLPNILRVMMFKPATARSEDTITVFTFEIDDQTPEDLAVGLDNLRKVDGVLEVNLSAVMTKKGRTANQVQILGRPDAEDAIFGECFTQTTTLGVRYHQTRRRILRRQQVHAGPIGVKIARRPTGDTAKAEMDDIAARHYSHSARKSAATAAACKTLAERKKDRVK